MKLFIISLAILALSYGAIQSIGNASAVFQNSYAVHQIDTVSLL